MDGMKRRDTKWTQTKEKTFTGRRTRRVMNGHASLNVLLDRMKH